MEMMLNKKQILLTFLFEFKMGHKAVETKCSINNTFGPGTASECMAHVGSRSFAKEMRALKMRGAVANHWKLTTTS